MRISTISKRTRRLATTLAGVALTAALSATSAPAGATVDVEAYGRPGGAGFLNNYGAWEGAAGNDIRNASVACHINGGRRAQFDRIGVWAYNARAGMGKQRCVPLHVLREFLGGYRRLFAVAC